MIRLQTMNYALQTIDHIINLHKSTNEIQLQICELEELLIIPQNSSINFQKYFKSSQNPPINFHFLHKNLITIMSIILSINNVCDLESIYQKIKITIEHLEKVEDQFALQKLNYSSRIRNTINGIIILLAELHIKIKKIIESTNKNHTLQNNLSSKL